MDDPRAIVKTNGHVSVARVTDAWYVLCESRELKKKPLPRKLYGLPLVVFRDAEGAPAVLLDRCAHRNVPLSLGRVTEGCLECPYHGWQFDGGGRCTHVPSLTGKAPERSVVPSFATRERDGFVWVYASPNGEPQSEPFELPRHGAGYTEVRHVVEAPATLHATIENALDVPHTAHLHRGLFRNASKKNRIRAILTRGADWVQTEYVGEPRPGGLIGRMLSPSGGLVTHYDRFIMPSIIQVEYRIGDENHILVTAICTPVDDYLTRLHAVVAYRTRFPGWVLKPALFPIALSIFGQDARILARQTETVQRFGGEHYMSTELDLMGPQIWRLLRRAEMGKPPVPEEGGWRREVDLIV